MADFSFKSLWENAGRWLVPGGLVVDFVVKKMAEYEEKALIEKTLQDISQTTASAFTLSSETAEAAPIPVSKAFLLEPSSTHEMSTARIDQLDTQFSALKTLQATFEQHEAVLPAQSAHRLNQLEVLFKDGTPSLEQSIIFHADQIEQAGGQAGVLTLSLYEGQEPGLVMFNVEQAKTLAAQIDARSAQLAFERGETIPEPVTLQTAVTMLARMNDLAAHTQQAVGIEIGIDREGNFLLNARTAQELALLVQPEASQALSTVVEDKKAPVRDTEPLER